MARKNAISAGQMYNPSMQEDWWQQLGDCWLDVSLSTRTPEITRADADWIQQALRLEPGMKVLDVPCGDGRLSLELAARAST